MNFKTKINIAISPGSKGKQEKYLFLIPVIFMLFTAKSMVGQSGYNGNGDDKNSFVNPTPYEIVKVNQPAGNQVKNVILMIGDGMGLTQISTAWVANSGKLNLDNFPYTGLTRTYAYNKLITDSGAAGTALATGHKTLYHAVGVDTSGNKLPSLVDLASKKGLSTAIVVSCGLTDATPATFLAGNIDRDDEEELASDFLMTPADYIFGGGRTKFAERKDKRNLLSEMASRGYSVATTWDEARMIQTGKVFALVTEGQLPLANERGTLWQDAVVHSLALLNSNPNGFFAMFEGSRIDDCGHWQDLPALMGEIFDFDQTIGKVLEWAESDGQTLVIVLADHETGGLTLLDGDISKAYVKGHFSTGGHSDIQVPVYAFGPGAEKFTGTYENTGIFLRISELLGLEY